MVLKLYGIGMSTCTRRVLMALEEKGLQYELNVIQLAKGEHKKPEFLKMQPFGQIPVLDDDGYLVYESRAIIHYLDNKFKGQGTNLTHIEDPKKYGLIEQWLSIEVSHYNTPVTEVVSELLFKPIFRPGEPIDQEKAKASKAKLEAALDIYEKHLSAGNEYLANNEFSLADLSHIPYGVYLEKTGNGDAFEKRPNVAAWWKRITSRSSWVKVASL